VCEVSQVAGLMCSMSDQPFSMSHSLAMTYMTECRAACLWLSFLHHHENIGCVVDLSQLRQQHREWLIRGG